MKQEVMDTFFMKTMGGFAVALGIECIVFIALKIPIESWGYGVIALQAIVMGVIAILPISSTIVVQIKEKEIYDLRARVAELEEKAVIVENKEQPKPINKIQQLLDELGAAQKGER